MSPQPAPAGLDDPTPTAPASAAHEVAPQDCAEVVRHATRLGAPTAKSCENAGKADGWDDMPTFWFDSPEGMDRFAGLVEHLQNGRRWRWYLPSRSLPLEILSDLANWLMPGIIPRHEPKGGTYAVAIPADDLPRVTEALRAIPTPSPYGPPPSDLSPQQ